MRRSPRAALALLGAPLAPLAAPAQDTLPPFQLTFDLGFVDASGNSELTSFSLGDKLSWRSGRLVLSQTARVLYGRTDGRTTSESYDAGGRAEYTLTNRVGWFVFVAFQRDPFAGIASRWAGGPGVAVALVRAARDTLSLESAITQQRQRSIAGTRQSFGATRTAATYKHLFGAATMFTQSLEWTANLETLDDMRLNSETALTAPLSRQIALRVSYVIRHDNLPEPGFERTDRVLTTGIQIAL